MSISANANATLAQVLNQSDWQLALRRLRDLPLDLLSVRHPAQVEHSIALSAESLTEAIAQVPSDALGPLVQWLGNALAKVHWDSDASRSITRAITAIARKCPDVDSLDALGVKCIKRLVCMWRRGATHAATALVALCSNSGNQIATKNVHRFVAVRGVFVAGGALTLHEEALDALRMLAFAAQHPLTADPRYGAAKLVYIIEALLNNLAPVTSSHTAPSGYNFEHLASIGIHALKVLQHVLEAQSKHTQFDMPEGSQLADAVACFLRRIPTEANSELRTEAETTLKIMLDIGLTRNLPSVPAPTQVTQAAQTASVRNTNSTPRRKRSRWTDADPAEQDTQPDPKRSRPCVSSRMQISNINTDTNDDATTATDTSRVENKKKSQSRFRHNKMIDDDGVPSPTRVTMEFDK